MGVVLCVECVGVYGGWFVVFGFVVVTVVAFVVFVVIVVLFGGVMFSVIVVVWFGMFVLLGLVFIFVGMMLYVEYVGLCFFDWVGKFGWYVVGMCSDCVVDCDICIVFYMYYGYLIGYMIVDGLLFDVLDGVCCVQRDGMMIVCR